MKTRRSSLNSIILIFIAPLVYVFNASDILAQGSLTPPGAPSPTMKTLSQIEPRTPISTLPYTISSSGSYYVTANLTGSAGNNGIIVNADNVDLDLQGFSLIGAPSSGNGIYVNGQHLNLRIHDGTILNWASFGVNGTNANYGQIDDLRVFNYTNGGIVVGNGNNIVNCIVYNNGTTGTGNGITAGDMCELKDSKVIASGATGIAMGNYGVIADCLSVSNFYGAGFQLGDDNTVVNCTAAHNFYPGGLVVGNNCTLIGCTVSSQEQNLYITHGIVTANNCTIKNCTTDFNDAGIYTGDSCNVIECTANDNSINAGTGIVVGNFCKVRGCVANNNEYGGISTINACYVADNLAIGTLLASPDIYNNGTNSVVVNNMIETNFFFGGNGNSKTANAYGTIETIGTLNTDKNPQGNYTH